MRSRLTAPLALTALLAAACGGGGSSNAPADADAGAPDAADGQDASEDAVEEPFDVPPGTTLEVENLLAVPNPSNALSFFVEWETTAPATSTLAARCGEEPEITLTAEGDGPLFEVFLGGLLAESTCSLTVTATSEDGQEATLAQDLEVGALPDYLPQLEVQVAEADQMEPGWTLVNLTNHFDGIPLTVALIDPQGRYRWYYQLPIQSAGSDSEVRVVGEGVMVCGRDGLYDPVIVDWTGSQVWTAPLGMSHDCRFVDEEEQTLRYLFSSYHTCPEGFPANGINEYDRVTGEVTWSWHICDAWLPEEIVPDWSHLNTIEPFPDEDAILISSRSQHSLFKVDRGSGEVAWGLGLAGDFAMDEGDRFYRQHAPEIQPDGNIVLFDNGSPTERPFSRVLELAYDEGTMEAEVVWSYTPDPPIFAPIWGDADRLPGGTTLATFGLRDTGAHTYLIEVDAEAQEVWKVQLPLKWGVYRADRVPTDVIR